MPAAHCNPIPPLPNREDGALLETPVILSQFICFGDYILKSQLLETREF